MLALHRAKDAEAAHKVRAAAVALLFRSRLFGLLLLGEAIQVQERPTAKTMETNGRVVFYSPTWVLERSPETVMFALLHELLHCFHNHVRRCGDRIHKLYNYAADVRVAHDGLTICRANGQTWKLDPDHVPAHEWAKTLTVEQIYEELLKEQQQKDLQRRDTTTVPDDYEPDMDANAEEGESAEQESAFRSKLAQDITQAQMAEEHQHNKDLADVYGPALAERIKELKRCDVPWDVLLKGRLCGELGHDSLSWIPPNRYFFPEIVLPSKRATYESELLLGIDISGSITDDDLKRFRACVMPAATRAVRTTIITFDQVVRERLSSTRPTTLLRELKFKTGAHSRTDTTELFEEVDRRRPSAVVIITDGYVRLPERAYPSTHWVLTPHHQVPPWGRTYHLRPSW